MCNLVLHCHVHNSLPLDLIVSHFNSVHTVGLHFLKIHLNSILRYYIIVDCRILVQDFLHFKGYKSVFTVRMSQSNVVLIFLCRSLYNQFPYYV
jgi:hypothetical protein